LHSAGIQFERQVAAEPLSALPSILTTHHKRSHPAWTRRTVLLPGWYQAFEAANESYLRSLWWALRLFRESRRFDAVVTGAEHCGMIFAMLQALFRSPERRRPHIMIDFPWAACPGPLKLALKILQMRIAAPAIDEIYAHASPEEAARFTSALRVRPGLFRFVPFHYWLEEPPPDTTSGGYVYSGGNYGRDYATLLEALAGSGHRTIICSQTGNGLRGLHIPENVQVIGVSHERFYELMAGAEVVVVPLMKDDIHPGGHTVVVNAMALGKPIIVAGPAEYRSYIEDGCTGLVTPAGDSVRLREAIDRVLADRELARMLASNAKAGSVRFTPELFFDRVFDSVDRAVARRRNTSASAETMR
jgi:hypothetical protein